MDPFRDVLELTMHAIRPPAGGRGGRGPADD